MTFLTMTFTIAAFLSVFVTGVSELRLSRLKRVVREDFKQKYGALDIVPINELRNIGGNESKYVTWDSFRMAAVIVSVASTIGSIVCFFVVDVPSGSAPAVGGIIVLGCVGVIVAGLVAVKLLIPIRWVRTLFI